MGTQYKVMVGSDSSVYFSLEDNSDEGKILNRTVDEKGFVKNEYPILERRTGHSIKGTTESIESAEIRKGRTKSAPRKGNSSSDGSLDIELSPTSYDDIFEAALRGEWKLWTSDYGDKKILKDIGSATFAAGDGKFLFKSGISQGADVYMAKRLIAQSADTASGKSISTNERALILSDACDYEISQLQVGTRSKLFDAVVAYGGPDGSLYQDFTHLAVNTMSLSVSPGQIVTGSFGFMGANNPDLEDIGVKLTADATKQSGKLYFSKDEETGEFSVATVGSSDNPSALGLYEADADNGFTKTLANRFNDSCKPASITEWIADLKDVKETSTDQFTAREGFLIVNGTEVDYGSNLTFELNNGLKKLFAIFRPDAISAPAMTLDVTGTLDAYLIKGHTEDLFNYSTKDTNVELIFTFQDKEEDPENLYVFQIFKTKLDKDFGGGTDELTVSLPYTSFEERAVRVFRLKKRTVLSCTFDKTNGLKVNLAPVKVPNGFDYASNAAYPSSTEGVKAIVKMYNKTDLNTDVYGTYLNAFTYGDSTGLITASRKAGDISGTFLFVVEYNGVTYKKWYTVA